VHALRIAMAIVVVPMEVDMTVVVVRANILE